MINPNFRAREARTAPDYSSPPNMPFTFDTILSLSICFISILKSFGQIGSGLR